MSDVDVLRIGPCQIPGRNHSRENARVDSDTQVLDVAAAIAAKGISRAGNVRYRTVGLAVNTRGKRDTWDAEWHPKRATSRGKYRFWHEDVYRMLHAFSQSEHISGVSGRKPGFIPLESEGVTASAAMAKPRQD